MGSVLHYVDSERATRVIIGESGVPRLLIIQAP